MKKTILTAGFLFATHFLVTAQSLALINTNENMVRSNTKFSRAVATFKTPMNGSMEFIENEPISEYDRYMIRSSNKRTAGWLIFSGGALGAVIAIATFPKDYGLFYNTKSTEKQAETSSIIFITGALVMLGSIPFFVSAHSDKRKARLILSNQKTVFGIPHRNVGDITGITMRISLGRYSKTILQSPVAFL